MYERYTHTERTVVERGEYQPLSVLGVVCILWVVFFVFLGFIFAVTDGLLVALGIGAIGLVGLFFLLMVGTIPKAKQPQPPTLIDTPPTSTALRVVKPELAKRGR
jgi:hypothetical protein